jgi:type IX secretion system PorP/SprF family membrane protein
MTKKISIFLIVNLFTYAVIAQPFSQYSQYMINGFMINSAMAGYDGFTSFNLTSRQQWLGINDAPSTISMSFQTRILKRSYIIKREPIKQENKFIPARTGRVGLGINLYSDRNGSFSNTGITFSYAYHIPLQNAQLSLGLSGSISQIKVNINNSDFRESGDKTLSNDRVPFYIPDANVGIFYSNRKFYAGFSVAELFQSPLKLGSNAFDAYQLKRHYFILAGYRLNNQVNVVYEPTILIKTTEQFFPQIDFSIKAYFYENYWMGVSYRTANTMIFFLGVKKNRFYASYAFDYSFNAIQTFTFGTHEINLAFKFGDSAKRYRWLNRF